MKITIFGAGYVGLVTGACFADVGYSVMVVDVNRDRVEMLRSAKSPIYEPGLDKLLEENIAAGRLQFTMDGAQGIEHGEYLFIAVGTPSDESGAADLQYVMTVAQTIGAHMNGFKIIINKSTVPVGTADKVHDAVRAGLSARGELVDFAVVSNPEFLKEGAAIKDFTRPDRIIIGASHGKALEKMRALYAPFDFEGGRIISMDARSAELTKYASNAFLATKISFINELSTLAEKVGANVDSVRDGMGTDQRIGNGFLNAGCGYGGSCFPKDLRALQRTANDNDMQLKILAAVEEVNCEQKKRLFHKINEYFNNNLQNKVITLWGLAFKPNTDDMREAASCALMEALWQAGAIVQAYDPVAMNEAVKLYGEKDNLRLCDSMDTALIGADALAVVTEWQEFHSPSFDNIKKHLRNPVIFDGRNIYSPKEVAEQGVEYFSIGRS